MAVYADTASSKKIIQEFQVLSDEERHHVQLQLLEGTEARELKVLYEKIKQLLAFDCLSELPSELAEKVLSYLEVASVCAVAQCCRKWRDLTNRDTIWYALCQQKSYVKFENLPVTPFSEHVSISPHHKQDLCQLRKLCSDTNMCKWKLVYIKASALMRHWKMGIYKVAPLLKGHRLQVTAIACSNDFLVSGSSDSTSRIWSLKSLECLHVLEGHTDAVNCIAIKNDIIVTGCSDSVVRVYDAHSGQCLKLLHSHSGSVDHIVFDGSIAISGGSDCSLRVWDVQNGKLIHTLIGHTEEIECLIMCEEDNLALTGSWDCTLRVWDVVAGICKLVLTGHTEVVYCCTYTYVPSGDDSFSHRLYSGGGDAVVKAWDIRKGDNVLTLEGHTQEVLSVKCTKELIASSSSDSTVRIWRVHSGICLHVLRGHIGVVRCLSFKGNNILISGGDRKRIIAWNTETGEELYTVHKQQILLHKLCVTYTQIITASPDSPGSISIISYW